MPRTNLKRVRRYFIWKLEEAEGDTDDMVSKVNKKDEIYENALSEYDVNCIGHLAIEIKELKDWISWIEHLIEKQGDE
jgi:hypothetical protein